MKIFKNLAVPLVLTVLAFFVHPDRGDAVERDNWRFAVEPYLLATNIDGDASIGRVSGAAVDVSFSDILGHLEAAFMISGEVYHSSGWGLLVDYGFMKLGEDSSGPMGGIVSTEVRQEQRQIRQRIQRKNTKGSNTKGSSLILVLLWERIFLRIQREYKGVKSHFGLTLGEDFFNSFP